MKEYLVSERFKTEISFKFNISHHFDQRLAQTRLLYLLFFDDPLIRIPVRPAEYPFLDYAARFWLYHARSSEKYGGAHVQQLIKDWFLSKQTYSNCVQTYNPDFILEKEDTLPNPLYYASYTGAVEPLQWILETNPDLNAISGHFRTALRAACAETATSRADEMIVKILLDAGADVNADSGHSSCIEAASTAGSEAIVRQLLEAGAKVNVCGGYFGSALHSASFYGYEAIVDQLLKAGADLNLVDEFYGTAIYSACFRGHEGVVGQLLVLKAGADANPQSGRHESPLQLAAYFRYTEIAKKLLEAGADANARGGEYNTALEAACYSGHNKVLELLVQHNGGTRPDCEADDKCGSRCEYPSSQPRLW